MPSKRLSYDAENLVQDHLEGLTVYAPNVRLLDGFRQIKVAVDGAHNRSCVALVSGGGSGHEPAFAGYIGKGMLAAAACGDVYAAPSVDAVLAAIRSVTGDGGCLLLPLNYTGDRLNFGLAEQRARTEGYRVRSVLVGDDCAIPDGGLVGRRGLAGSILAIKLLGAMAARGASLEALTEAAQTLMTDLGTIGVGLDTSAPPGQPPEPSRLASDEIELGLGIHGEPGVEVVKDLSMESVVNRMTNAVVTYTPDLFSSGTGVTLLVNSLGGMSPMELDIIAKTAVEILRRQRGLSVDYTLVGTYLTSITVAGFSLTLLKMRSSYGELLMDSTEAPAWSLAAKPGSEDAPKIPIPQSIEPEFASEPLTEIGSRNQRCLRAVVQCLIEKEEVLNGWDAKVGDGDCGSTLVTACRGIEEDMERYPFNHASALLSCIGRSIARASGGTSGALYSIFFTAGSSAMASADGVGMAPWVTAFESGVEAIKKYGRAKMGDRTMLDALEPACRALRESLDEGRSLTESLSAVRAQAAIGADATMEMVARAGRAAYVPPELFKTTPDPGAKAVAFWLAALTDAVI